MADDARTSALSTANSALVRNLIATPLTAVVGLALWPLRVTLGGIGKMRELLGVLIFLGIGVLIAAAAVWYVSIVVDWLRSSSGPPAIGTVTVLGLPEPQSKAVGNALPAMVLAELRRVGERTNEAKRQLQQLEQTKIQQTTVQDPRFAQIPIPENLKTEVAIPQQIAGVEIGWLLSWVKDVLAPTNVIDLTVTFDEKKASIFGHAKGPAAYAFYLHDDTGRPDALAQAAAAAIIQHEQRKGELGVEPLAPSDYLPVVDALSAYATYERVLRSWSERQGRPDFTRQFQAQLASIAKIAETHTQWSELQWLAAEIAEGAGDREKALEFTINEQRLTPRDDPRYARLDARLTRLTERKVALASPADKLESARKAAGNLLPAELVAPIRKFINVSDPAPQHTQIRIASLLAPWGEASETATVLAAAQHQPDELTDYATNKLQVTRIVAPNAKYEFVGMDDLTAFQIVKGLNAIAHGGADVLSFSFGGIRDKIVFESLRAAASKMVVVLAAGNEAGPSQFSEIEDVALVVGATELVGSAAEYSASSPKAVWAPGAEIPVISPVTGEITRTRGTSFSSALVAGAAALLKAAHPAAKPMDIITALRDTAKPVVSGGPRVIDVQAAIAKLGELVAARPSGTK